MLRVTSRTVTTDEPAHIPTGYEQTDQGRVLVRADAKAWLEPLGLSRLEDVFALPAEARSRWKALARLTAPDGRAVFVKRYDYHRGEVWLRGAVKWNFPVFSGPRELKNLLALAEAGLRVPTPLTAGEEDTGPRRRSFVALMQLDGVPLDGLPAPPTPRERRERIADVADLVRRLHQAGFWHKDLYLCNVFQDEQAGLGLLDCERVDRREGGPPLRWRIKDLAALDFSAAWPTASERLRFLKAYLQLTWIGPKDQRLARAIRRKAKRIRRRGAKR